MRNALATGVVFSMLAGVAAAQAPAGQAAPAPAAPQAKPAAPADPNLPASGDTAKAALEKSPRHGEYVDVKLAGGGTPIKTWVVYPERKDKAPVVIVIHEIFGLSDWIRAVADQLAREGFIAVAPDLLSGKGPGGGGTDSVAATDVMNLIRQLTPDEVATRLDAVRAAAIALPAANGKSATIGFCWGGGVSFAYAAHEPALNAAVVYYGTPPTPDAMARIKAPVLGLYGGNDARVTSTVEGTDAEMKKQAKAYDKNVFEGAGHGFLRAQTGSDGANLKATQAAWPKTVAFLKERTK